MTPIHNILVIVDSTAEEHPAIRKEALLAVEYSAEPANIHLEVGEANAR